MNQPKDSYIFSELSPQEAMWHMTYGYRISQAIYVAAKLGIADLLQDGSKHCDELETETNIPSHLLYRLLRALASVGVFAETESKCFQLTPRAACLQNNLPDSLRNLAIFKGELDYPAFGSLMYSMQTGKNAFEYLHGMDFNKYCQKNSNAGEIFDRAMTTLTAREIAAILEAYDFSVINKIVDVAGGQGNLLAHVLQKNPMMKGVLFEQPHLMEKAQQLLAKAGVLERCELKQGDIFKSIPAGGDAYLLKYIIHNWEDEPAISILKNCHQSMKQSDKLLIIEAVIPPENQPFKTKFLDLEMICSSGKESKKEKIKNILNKAGFELIKIIPTKLEISIIESKKK